MVCLPQRIWKKVAVCLAGGMCDHTADFNRDVTADAVPASWTLKVSHGCMDDWFPDKAFIDADFSM